MGVLASSATGRGIDRPLRAGLNAGWSASRHGPETGLSRPDWEPGGRRGRERPTSAAAADYVSSPDVRRLDDVDAAGKHGGGHRG